MKRRRRGGRDGGEDDGGKRKNSKGDEGEIIDILLNLPQVVEKSELLNKNTNSWNSQKKRSVLVSKSKSKSTPSSHREIDESRPDKSTAAEDDERTATLLSSLPSGSGNDSAADNPNQQSPSAKLSKRKATDDLIRRYNEMQIEILGRRKTEAMENRKLRKIKRQKIRTMDTLHKKRTVRKLELEAKIQDLKAARQEINKKKARAPPPPSLQPPPPASQRPPLPPPPPPSQRPPLPPPPPPSQRPPLPPPPASQRPPLPPPPPSSQRPPLQPPPPLSQRPPLPPPPPPQQLQQHYHKFLVNPNNGKVVGITCSSDSNSVGRSGPMDPSVKYHFVKTNYNPQHYHPHITKSTPPPPPPPTSLPPLPPPPPPPSPSQPPSSPPSMVDPKKGKKHFEKKNRNKQYHLRLITRFAPPPPTLPLPPGPPPSPPPSSSPPRPRPPVQQHSQQSMVDPIKDKVGSTNSNLGVRFGSINVVDPRGKIRFIKVNRYQQHNSHRSAPPPPPPPQQQQQLHRKKIYVNPNNGKVVVNTRPNNTNILRFLNTNRYHHKLDVITSSTNKNTNSASPPPPPIPSFPSVSQINFFSMEHVQRAIAAKANRLKRIMVMREKKKNRDTSFFQMDHDQRIKAAKDNRFKRLMVMRQKNNKETSYHILDPKLRVAEARRYRILKLKEKKQNALLNKPPPPPNVTEGRNTEDPTPSSVPEEARKMRIMRLKEKKTAKVAYLAKLAKKRARTRAARHKKQQQTDPKKHVELKPDDLALLKVWPLKGVMRFGKKGRMGIRYLGPFKVVKTIGSQFCKLDLPSELTGIHDTFHVSYLKKYTGKQTGIIPLSNLKVEAPNKLTEDPEAVYEAKTKKVGNKEIEVVRVKWKHSHGRIHTWESKEEMKERYPNFVDYDAVPRRESVQVG